MSFSAKSAALRIWAPVGAWTVVILVLSNEAFSATHTASLLQTILQVILGPLDPEHFEVIHRIVRKLAHVVEYAVLGMLNLRAFGLQFPERPLPWSVAMACTLAVSCAVVDELNQALLATRTGSVLDVLLDGTAATMGALAVAVGWGRGNRSDVAQ